jgi:hypothetical protein
MLEDEKDSQRWRILWAGAIALTRAVGHVLDKVDGKDPLIKQTAKRFFKRWMTEPEHRIFEYFVEHERNNVLKEYRSAVHPLASVPVAAQMSLKSLEGDSEKLIYGVELDENIYRPLIEGPWAGLDGRDVLQEAIDWWAGQLDLIDDEVTQLRS